MVISMVIKMILQDNQSLQSFTLSPGRKNHCSIQVSTSINTTTWWSISITTATINHCQHQHQHHHHDQHIQHDHHHNHHHQHQNHLLQPSHHQVNPSTIILTGGSQTTSTVTEISNLENDEVSSFINPCLICVLTVVHVHDHCHDRFSAETYLPLSQGEETMLAGLTPLHPLNRWLHVCVCVCVCICVAASCDMTSRCCLLLVERMVSSPTLIQLKY